MNKVILLFSLLLSTSVFAQSIENADYQLVKNGFWYDIGIGGIAYNSKNYVPCSFPGIGGCDPWGNRMEESLWSFSMVLNTRIGNKWFLYKKGKYQLGVQTTWLESGYIPFVHAKGVYVSGLGVGFASQILLTPQKAIELNLSAAPFGHITNVGYIGVLGNFDVKYRSKFWFTCFRLSYGYGSYYSDQFLHSIMATLTAGMKF